MAPAASVHFDPAPEGFYFQAFGSLVTLPAAGYHYNMDWLLVLAGLAPAGMAASLAAPEPEAAKFTPNLRVVLWHGLNRHERREEVGGGGLVVRHRRPPQRRSGTGGAVSVKGIRIAMSRRPGSAPISETASAAG